MQYVFEKSGNNIRIEWFDGIIPQSTKTMTMTNGWCSHANTHLLSADPKNKGNHPLVNQICHREIVVTTIPISAHSVLQLLFLFVDPKKDISQLFNFIILSFTWYNILLELYLLSQTITNHHPHSNSKQLIDFCHVHIRINWPCYHYYFIILNHKLLCLVVVCFYVLMHCKNTGPTSQK